MSQNQIEVEIRGIITEEEYNLAIQKLDTLAEKKEEDNREAYFFIIPNKNLKVSNSISKNKAKLALKIGNESETAVEEIEVSIKPEDTEKLVSVLNHLGFDKFKKSDQKRINYWYKNTEIAIKWSQDWGFHFEMEQVVNPSEEVNSAHEYLIQTALGLGLKPNTEQEIEQFISNLRKSQGIS